MELGGIQCYLQKKLSRIEVLELLSKKDMQQQQQNDNEKIIFTEGEAPPLANPSKSFPLSSTASEISKHDFDKLKSEYRNLKFEHEKLKQNYVHKSEFEALKNEFETFKDETEHKIHQLYLALGRQGSVAEDSSCVGNTVPLFFETSKLRESFVVQIAFYDQPIKRIDLVEVFQNSTKCKDGITTVKEISDLYKNVICKIWGRDKLHHYTAATRVKKGLTPISADVIEAIKMLLYDGFNVDQNNDATNPDIIQKRNEIDKVVKSASSYLFNNMRRSKNQTSPRNSAYGFLEDHLSHLLPEQQNNNHGYSISDSDSEDNYPKRIRIQTIDDCYKIEQNAQF